LGRTADKGFATWPSTDGKEDVVSTASTCSSQRRHFSHPLVQIAGGVQGRKDERFVTLGVYKFFLYAIFVLFSNDFLFPDSLVSKPVVQAVWQIAVYHLATVLAVSKYILALLSDSVELTLDFRSLMSTFGNGH